MKKIMQVLAAIFIFMSWFLLLPFACAQDDEMKVFLSAAFCSEKGISYYEEMAKYLSGKVGKNIKILSGMNYETGCKMLQIGKAQVGFLCGYTYIRKKKELDLELLVAPIMANPKYKNEPKYISYVIVPVDSPARSFTDLQGKTYLFSDPLSNSGYNVPRYYLAKMGFLPFGFFKDIKFSGAHEKSIEMVANGFADGASVDSLVWDYDNIVASKFTSKTKIIAEHAAGGIPPVVVSRGIGYATKNALKAAFLGMADDPAGKVILDKLFVSKFIEVTDANYDDIFQMEKFGLDFEQNNK